MSSNWSDLEKKILELSSSQNDEFDFFDNVIKTTNEFDLDKIFGSGEKTPAPDKPVEKNLDEKLEKIQEKKAENRSPREQREYEKVKKKLESKMKKAGKSILFNENVEKNIVNSTRPSSGIKTATFFSFLLLTMLIIFSIVFVVFAGFGGIIKSSGDADAGISYQKYTEGLIYYGEYTDDSGSNLALQSRLEDVVLTYWEFEEDPNNPGKPLIQPDITTGPTAPPYKYTSDFFLTNGFPNTQFYLAVNSPQSPFAIYNDSCWTNAGIGEPTSKDDFFAQLYNLSLDWIFNLAPEHSFSYGGSITDNQWDPIKGGYDILKVALDTEIDPVQVAINEIDSLFNEFLNDPEVGTILDEGFDPNDCLSPVAPFPSDLITTFDYTTSGFYIDIVSVFEGYSSYTINQALGEGNELLGATNFGEQTLASSYDDYSITIFIMNYGTIIVFVSSIVFIILMTRLGKGSLNSKWIASLVGLVLAVIPGILIIFGKYRNRNYVQDIATETKLELFSSPKN